MVRCKFVCVSKTECGDTVHIYMQPVYDGSKENKEFFKYTPGGEISLNVVNPEAAKQIEQGKEYYIDISPAK
jgi:hypothetical protein